MENLGFTPIIVGGAMRTGTSLLQNVLSTSPSANDMMVECQYLTAQLTLYTQWQNQNERGLVDFFDGKDGLKDYTTKLVFEFLKQTHLRQGEPENLILKHPEMTVFFPLLGQMLPNAKFVVSVRDPKDVVASMLVVAEKQKELGRSSNMLHAGRNMAKLTKLFLSFYRGLGNFPKEKTARLQYVKYEDLVLKTDELLPRLGQFTGLDLSNYDPTAEWKYTRPRKYNKAFDTKIRGKGLSDSSIGNYREHLSDKECMEVDKTAEAFMRHFRYPLTFEK